MNFVHLLHFTASSIGRLPHFVSGLSRLGNLSTIVDASVSGWRAVADYNNLGRYYADFTDFVGLHTPDPEGVAYSILQLGIAYFDAIDTAVSVGLIVQGIFDWEMPTQLLSHLILPLGGILLFLRSFLDIYSIWKGQKLLEEINQIELCAIPDECRRR